MGVAVVKKRFVDLQQKVIWRLPERKLVRYVRIQLEQQNFLTLAQVRHRPGSASQPAIIILARVRMHASQGWWHLLSADARPRLPVTCWCRWRSSATSACPTLWAA